MECSREDLKRPSELATTESKHLDYHMFLTCARDVPGSTMRVCIAVQYLYVCTQQLYYAEGRQVTAWIMDGITLGRPCCGIPNCKGILPSTKDRFCYSHREEYKRCVIRYCSNLARSNHRTCDILSHALIEETHEERQEAAFQRQKRKERSRAAHTTSGEDVDSSAFHTGDEGIPPEETYEIVNGQAFPVKPSDTPTQAAAALQSIQPEAQIPMTLPSTTAMPSDTSKLKAKFGRNVTHNEQILVCSCGVIVARDTFFNAEAIPSCAVRLESTNS